MVGRTLASLALASFAACAGLPPPRTEPLTSVRFAPARMPQGLARSNRDLAEDFLDVAFALESGAPLDGVLRYETPIRVYLRSPELAAYRRDLDELLARLRSEARIDIAETRDPARAQINIEAVSEAQITRIFPTAACFIVPGEASWRDFMRRAPDERLRWSDQNTLKRAVIFLPLDTTPQDVRDCLNEEITQALGPANDLYRLPDTIWNDDNFHGLATSFDMLMLRLLYQPDLHSGMSRADVVSRLPQLLARINPVGQTVAPQPRQPESRAWAGAIEAALSRTAPHFERLAAARLATQIAAEMRPVDHRLGVSLLTLGRLNLRSDPALAARNFSQAYRLFQSQFGPGDLRTAQAGVHAAALAVAAGQNRIAIKLADASLPAAQGGQNAILIAGLLSIKAEALFALERTPEAQAVRLDSLRWARYGFGDEGGAFAREQAQIAALLRLE